MTSVVAKIFLTTVGEKEQVQSYPAPNVCVRVENSQNFLVQIQMYPRIQSISNSNQPIKRRESHPKTHTLKRKPFQNFLIPTNQSYLSGKILNSPEQPLSRTPRYRSTILSTHPFFHLTS